MGWWRMMRAGPMALTLALAIAAPAGAQDFAGLARLDPAASAIEAAPGGGLAVTLALSQPVPWRVMTLDAPPRLVLDLRRVDWRGAGEGLVQGGPAAGAQAGEGPEGWSRLVIALAEPLGVAEAGMTVGPDGGARLVLRLDPVTEEAFAAAAAAPAAAPAEAPAAERAPPDDGPLVVAIDPGHGGIDPGAEHGGAREAHVVLALGIELADALARAGMRPVLTRTDDTFVPLATRMTIARAAGADVLLSLHADALESDAARGASVYTLSDEGVDDASERMVERHERGDLLAGLDLAEADDTVATALLDLARQDTTPASRRLGDGLVAGMGEAGATLNTRPRREARLAVLNAADFPSVLVEVGFLSDEGDRARLSSPEGRAPIVAGLLAGLRLWAEDEATREALRLR